MNKLFVALALVFALSSGVRAEKWALLIGINDYEDRNYIASLGAADNDARKLRDVLKNSLGYPAANIDLLVSDGDNKPTRANIIQALGKLADNVQPGDTVFVFYSGHGTEINGVTYLLPHDFKGRNKFTGTQTALEVSIFKSLLSQVKAKAIIMAWDMCRNDPFGKGKSGDAARSKLADTKTWKVVPLTARGTDPPVVVNLFACSPGECSYEWQDKTRGYFAWFLEEGMKGAAADTQGNVTLGSLSKYVRSQVIATTKSSEPAVQSPTTEMTGASPEDFVLVGNGKPTPTTPVKNIGNGTTKPVNTRTTLKFTGAIERTEILIDGLLLKGNTFFTDITDSETKEFTISIKRPGDTEPTETKKTLERGKQHIFPIFLDSVPVKTNNTGTPPPVAANSGELGEVFQKIRAAHRIDGLQGMRAFRVSGTGEGTIANAKGTYNNYELIQHPDGRFRYVYNDSTINKPVNAGFNGKEFWKTTGNKSETTTPDNRYSENPIGIYLYVFSQNLSFNDKFSKLNITTPYLQGKDTYMGDFKIFFNPNTFQITQIDIKKGGAKLVYFFKKYYSLQGVLIPDLITLEAYLLVKAGEFNYTFNRIEPNAALGTDYYLNGR